MTCPEDKRLADKSEAIEREDRVVAVIAVILLLACGFYEFWP